MCCTVLPPSPTYPHPNVPTEPHPPHAAHPPLTVSGWPSAQLALYLSPTTLDRWRDRAVGHNHNCFGYFGGAQEPRKKSDEGQGGQEGRMGSIWAHHRSAGWC